MAVFFSVKSPLVLCNNKLLALHIDQLTVVTRTHLHTLVYTSCDQVHTDNCMTHENTNDTSLFLISSIVCFSEYEHAYIYDNITKTNLFLSTRIMIIYHSHVAMQRVRVSVKLL